MQRAGLAVAQLTMAVAPHARVIWIACGPGNNGGDGFEAAYHLQRWGKTPIVTSLGNTTDLPADAQVARLNALEAGVTFADTIPQNCDLCIDAVIGMGRNRPLEGQYKEWVERMNTGTAPVISVDIPSGLDADTGYGQTVHVKAHITLSLLTLKPGLFSADGRDACGEIWFNNLGVDPTFAPSALLSAAPPQIERAHNTHKGSYGDVAIIGGGSGMTGAAHLAGRAALHGGAGRVYVGVLDTNAMPLDVVQPGLMFRQPSELRLELMTVVAGCGGGDAIQAHLPDILTRSSRLVLDADALNAIAHKPSLQNQLTARSPGTTVLTPHPLEAARLLHLTTQDIQVDRLGAAQSLANQFACTVVLKGSGTVIATSDTLPYINPTGNARLATAGTGDVLAGLIGARWATGNSSFYAARTAVFHHGHIADTWQGPTALTAQDLIQAL
jgi:hydroxyethylthiazole kinase-like uncharacterized protein yjeF